MSHGDHQDDAAQAASRRQFMLGSAAVAGVAAVLPATTAGAASPARQWASEADVLVVGSGAAALSAAIAVVRAGGSVIVIEKAPTIGGTSAKSAGAYWIPNNHLMRARGIADPKPDVVRYMVRDAYPARYRDDLPHLGAGENEFALIETYYDQAAAIIEDLEKVGAIRSAIADVYDYLDHSPLNKAPRGRALVPVRADGQIGRGLELVRQLRAWLSAKQVPMLVRHGVTGIERGPDGTVTGLAVASPEGPVFFGAKKAVIFGTGGYSQNQELLRTFQPGPIHGACSVPTAQGDFIKMGIENGAMIGNMANAWRSEVILEQALETGSVSVTLEFPPGDSMIIVNKYGRRVVNEKRNYNARGRVHFDFDPVETEYPNDLLFMIFDQRTLELFAGNMLLPPPGTTESYVIDAPTLSALGPAVQQRLDSLAGKIGKRTLSPDFASGLAAQIARFNADAAKGVDSEFQRGTHPYDVNWHKDIDSIERKDTKWPPNQGPNVTLYPIADRGPYHAIILGAGMLDTNGGPVTNAKSQVLDTHGKPIPRLYGAGNCVASPVGQGYWGAGATLGPALTFGTIAGRNAASEATREV